MAYLGTPIDTTNQFQSLQGKRFDGDGSTTDFTLDIAPSSTLDIEVFVENVRQDPNSAYTLSGTTLSFTGAPPSGTNNIYVVHQAKAVGTIDPPATESVAKTFTSGVTSSTTDNSDNLTLISTDDDANSGPNLRLYRNSSSPGDSDVLGQIDFEGRNDNSEDIVSARIQAITQDVTDGTEDGRLTINTIMDGTERIRINCHSGGITFRNADEEMRIDSSGNLLVGKTSANDTDVGVNLYSTGKASFVVAGDATIFNRTSDNGNIILLRSAGSNAGIIACHGNHPGDELSISGSGTNTSGVYFSNSNSTLPMKNNSTSDNTQDLGAGSYRWDDVYATNGTIQTSDQQEKNTITDSDLGLDFVNRLSPKSYIFNGKTRTHYGLIAQDVETVLSDISKTSADFAGFIKTDISEEQDGSSYRYGLRYNEFIAPLIKAVKELKAENDSLKARVTALEG